MAISPEIWETARIQFELGDSLDKIAKKTGINKSTISKKSKAQKWEKGVKSTLINEEVTNTIMSKMIAKKKSTFTDREINEYNRALNLELDAVRLTEDVALGFQNQIQKRQIADSMAIDALIVFKASELKKAKTPEDILAVEMKFRDHLGCISIRFDLPNDLK